MIPFVHAEIIEDIPGTGETMESGQSPTAPSPFAVSPPSQEREAYKKLGLTKQVLAAHTQKEEQAFLYRVRELRGLSSLKANCSEYLERQREQIASNGTSQEQSGSCCRGWMVVRGFFCRGLTSKPLHTRVPPTTLRESRFLQPLLNRAVGWF